MVKRIDRDLAAASTQDPAAFDQALAAATGETRP
jgi:hypothetical protein